MGNFIGALTGANAAKRAAQQAEASAQLSQQQSQQQEALAQSDQGQQLALLSKQQAVSDNSAAELSKPGIGRAMLGYNRRTSGTLGG